MTRLIVVCEGYSEESFVKKVLAPHLALHDVYATPTIVGTSRGPAGHKRRGGGHWKQWGSDLERLVRRQTPSGAWVTTMFDLYGLPRDFPDRSAIHSARTPDEKVQLAHVAILRAMQGVPGAHRLLPHVQCYEFEALVLAALDTVELWLDDPVDHRGLAGLRRELGETPPEEVNDGLETAPSKRLMKWIPSYDKILFAEFLELADMVVLKARCPRFGAWVCQLESL